MAAVYGVTIHTAIAATCESAMQAAQAQARQPTVFGGLLRVFLPAAEVYKIGDIRIMPIMIGRKHKLARTAAGLSLRGLEAAIDNRVTAQAISKYERNEAMPSSDTLIALADALDVSVDYLVGDQEMVLGRVDFRTKAIGSKRQKAQVEAKVLGMLEPYLAIEGLLDLPSLEWDKPRDAPYPVVNDLMEADRGARALRYHWGLGIEPSSNLVEILEERGIKVLATKLTNIDGLTVQVRRAGGGPVPVMVVNSQDWGERQRFTIAHELGHMLLSVRRGLANQAVEKAANRFAGAFLMPAEALWSEVGKRRTAIGWGELFLLKQLFCVSVQALTYRCRDLGIFSQSLFQRLFGEFERQGWRHPPYEEPFATKGEKPRRFKRLCLRSLAEGAITEPKAAELLGTSVRQLDRWMQAPPECKSG